LRTLINKYIKISVSLLAYVCVSATAILHDESCITYTKSKVILCHTYILVI